MGFEDDVEQLGDLAVNVTVSKWGREPRPGCVSVAGVFFCPLRGRLLLSTPASLFVFFSLFWIECPRLGRKFKNQTIFSLALPRLVFAARFFDRSPDTKTFKGGMDAYNNSGFYRQLGPTAYGRRIGSVGEKIWSLVPPPALSSKHLLPPVGSRDA